ncbi:H+-transporting two-sector ATPase [Sorangium cellulosum]|uniref:ATP synthase subunit b n=1 Tax=Sorangium cellulosum TaxID=56 RepID=A0A2L0FC39_SORCE|nr:ATP synthase F0 subunit B [Sorangium cellulosum]AUX49175.1 H+-transporting two-sector ATPase [Sorangium cellulosum]
MNPNAIHPLLASGGIAVDFDLTFIAQIALFSTFIVVLKPLLLDPLLRVFEERERRTDGAKREAREMDERAGELLTRYEAEIEKVRREAGVERERLRAEAAKIEAQIMAEARNETARILEEGKAKITAEVTRMRAELAAAQPALAAEIAASMIGREVRQ